MEHKIKTERILLDCGIRAKEYLITKKYNHKNRYTIRKLKEIAKNKKQEPDKLQAKENDFHAQEAQSLLKIYTHKNKIKKEKKEFIHYFITYMAPRNYKEAIKILKLPEYMTEETIKEYPYLEQTYKELK